MWGASDENERGEDLEEMLLELNLLTLNLGNEDTFSEGDKGTMIYITVVNEKALNLGDFDDWKVDLDESFSDHRYITFTGSKMTKVENLQRNLKKANWKIFKETLEASDWPEVESDSDLDKLADLFQNIIMAALDSACPMKPSLAKKNKQMVEYRLGKNKGER